MRSCRLHVWLTSLTVAAHVSSSTLLSWLPHRRIDLQECGVDYVAFSGHKLYAPFGAGVLVGRRDWLDEAQPYLAGGGAVREVTIESTEWACAPARHEAGSPNVLGAAAIATACETLHALDFDVIAEHEKALTAQLTDGLSAIEGVSLVRLWNDAPDAVGIVTFTVDGFEAGEIAAFLSAEHGIGVRDGRFCAHPVSRAPRPLRRCSFAPASASVAARTT